MCLCVFFQHHQAILQCSADPIWVSYTLTQFWHYLPPGRSHRLWVQSHKLPSASDASHIPDYHLCFWPTGYKLEIPETPQLLGFDKFPRAAQWTQRNTFLCLPVYYKKIKLKKSQLEDIKGKAYVKGCRARMLFLDITPPTVHQPWSSLNPILFGSLWSFHYIGTMN